MAFKSVRRSSLLTQKRGGITLEALLVTDIRQLSSR